ncbi:MAG: tRNA lysidine(34) synthetase TilS [Polyangiaceae bacterium]|nr:tRNA lysidine(34) synthetase TilS [Polyangiaceae bacterium]
MTPSLITVIGRAFAGETRLPRGSTLIVAVSGGPDSMALLDVAHRVAPKLGICLRAHGVDHGLRESASAELELAASFATSLGVPFDRTRVDVGRGSNLQARARKARYAALCTAARSAGAGAIATAHHADDRAETVLMRLLRGAGPRGLAALSPRTPLEFEIELVRPMLRARRSDVLAHLARHRISFASDPSNSDPRFLRARVRHELLPLLEELGPGIVRHLEAVADQLLALRGKGQASSFPLPRATELLLHDLAESRSPTARVWLPGGLVAAVVDDTKVGPRPRQRMAASRIDGYGEVTNATFLQTRASDTTKMK